MVYTALKNAILSEKIDWLAFTQAYNTSWDYPDYVDDHWKDIGKLPHYTNGQENKQGVRRYWNTENMKQGRYTVLDGRSWDTMREFQSDLLQSVNMSEKKTTRIDFALDITHSRLRPETVVKFLENGEVRTHAQSIPKQSDDWKGGFTQYVGRKGSETYTRIYDKQKEQNSSFAWVRVETVYQGDRAQPSLKAYCDGASVRQLIRRHVDFPTWADWNRIMVNPAAEVHVSPHLSRTREWLLRTVAKTMAREICLDEDHAFWFDFIERVKCEISLIDIDSGIMEF